jgi:hypothetical protein
MPGFIGKAPITSDIGLILELAVIVILFFGRFGLARKKRFKDHAILMLAAILMHAASILLIMIPSFEASLGLLFSDFFSPPFLITWIHAPVGSISIILGSYLVVNWRFRSPDVACFKMKRFMRPLWWLWTFSLSLGLLVFIAVAFF